MCPRCTTSVCAPRCVKRWLATPGAPSWYPSTGSTCCQARDSSSSCVIGRPPARSATGCTACPPEHRTPPSTTGSGCPSPRAASSATAGSCWRPSSRCGQWASGPRCTRTAATSSWARTARCASRSGSRRSSGSPRRSSSPWRSCGRAWSRRRPRSASPSTRWPAASKATGRCRPTIRHTARSGSSTTWRASSGRSAVPRRQSLWRTLPRCPSLRAARAPPASRRSTCHRSIASAQSCCSSNSARGPPVARAWLGRRRRRPRPSSCREPRTPLRCSQSPSSTLSDRLRYARLHSTRLKRAPRWWLCACHTQLSHNLK
mmetsp:Transcript_50062/g.131705  ORF Transcript_50062/g.131705 Transcript_50062/m.131705 type:complete len:317 (-) Transcript_50062:335-1285(-)